MVNIETLESVLELIQNKDVQEKAEEVARLFFSNGNITVNLLPIITFAFFSALRTVYEKYFIEMTNIFLVLLPLLLPAYDALTGLYSSALGLSNVAYSSNQYNPVSGYGYSARTSAGTVSF